MAQEQRYRQEQSPYVAESGAAGHLGQPMSTESSQAPGDRGLHHGGKNAGAYGESGKQHHPLEATHDTNIGHGHEPFSSSGTESGYVAPAGARLGDEQQQYNRGVGGRMKDAVRGVKDAVGGHRDKHSPQGVPGQYQAGDPLRDESGIPDHQQQQYQQPKSPGIVGRMKDAVTGQKPGYGTGTGNATSGSAVPGEEDYAGKFQGQSTEQQHDSKWPRPVPPPGMFKPSGASESPREPGYSSGHHNVGTGHDAYSGENTGIGSVTSGRTYENEKSGTGAAAYQSDKPGSGAGYQSEKYGTGSDYQSEKPGYEGAAYQSGYEDPAHQREKPGTGMGYQSEKYGTGSDYQSAKPGYEGAAYQSEKPGTGMGHQSDKYGTGSDYQSERPGYEGTTYQGEKPGTGMGHQSEKYGTGSAYQSDKPGTGTGYQETAYQDEQRGTGHDGRPYNAEHQGYEPQPGTGGLMGKTYNHGEEKSGVGSGMKHEPYMEEKRPGGESYTSDPVGQMHGGTPTSKANAQEEYEHFSTPGAASTPTEPNARHDIPTGRNDAGAEYKDPHGGVHKEGPRDDNVKKEGLMAKMMDKLHLGTHKKKETPTTP